MKQYRVRLSPLAEKKLDSILHYLEEEWTFNQRNQFLRLFTEKIDQITVFPKSCPESTIKEGLFKAVIDKHCSFYYRIGIDWLEIVNLIDNRQDPTRIGDKIEDDS